MTERKTLAIIGAVGAGSSACATVLLGANSFGPEINQTVSIIALGFSAIGTVITAGITYYKSALGMPTRP